MTSSGRSSFCTTGTVVSDAKLPTSSPLNRAARNSLLLTMKSLAVFSMARRSWIIDFTDVTARPQRGKSLQEAVLPPLPLALDRLVGLRDAPTFVRDLHRLNRQDVIGRRLKGPAQQVVRGENEIVVSRRAVGCISSQRKLQKDSVGPVCQRSGEL